MFVYIFPDIIHVPASEWMRDQLLLPLLQKHFRRHDRAVLLSLIDSRMDNGATGFCFQTTVRRFRLSTTPSSDSAGGSFSHRCHDYARRRTPVYSFTCDINLSKTPNTANTACPSVVRACIELGHLNVALEMLFQFGAFKSVTLCRRAKFAVMHRMKSLKEDIMMATLVQKANGNNIARRA